MDKAPSTNSVNETKSPAERKAILHKAYAGKCLKGGRRVARPLASQSEFEAVLVRGRRSAHGLHLCLTILTIGLWGPVWLAMWLAQREKREIASVDVYGNTAVTPA
jgi:hypothetical protein